MACDEGLVERIRHAVIGHHGYGERRMFGGVCFTLNGNMACGVVGSELMARVGPVAYLRALNEPHVREMDFTGRPMKGYVFIGVGGIAEDSDLTRWIDLAEAFVSTLPGKSKHSK
jgi:hypothetical protein